HRYGRVLDRNEAAVDEGAGHDRSLRRPRSGGGAIGGRTGSRSAEQRRHRCRRTHRGRNELPPRQRPFGDPVLLGLAGRRALVSGGHSTLLSFVCLSPMWSARSGRRTSGRSVRWTAVTPPGSKKHAVAGSKAT